MTPQEKAIRLVNRFSNEVGMFSNEAKQCALICIDERIMLLNELDSYFHEAGHDRNVLGKAMEIQLEVKQEINNL
jgi:hypothetical protein